jgi:hypothetical protein
MAFSLATGTERLGRVAEGQVAAQACGTGGTDGANSAASLVAAKREQVAGRTLANGA